MSSDSETKVWNRYKGNEEAEAVYGDKAIRLLYQTLAGQKLSGILARPFVSQLYGLYQQSALSKKKIPLFISNFKIQMHEFENRPFESFNDFFIRKFVPGVRPFVQNPQLPAFAEGRYMAFEKITDDGRYPVKGKYLKALDLLGHSDQAKLFVDGPLVIARLCPTDYHRFHFPDDGKILSSWRISGSLQSVNPNALKFRNDIFISNERNVTLLETKSFGRLAYIEVGAMMVGKIVQTHPAQTFKRGEEKGYFIFGGSTVILMGEKGKWIPDEDLLKNTAKGMETFVRLGDHIATI